MKRVIKDTPVLLLDDVLSELDSNRQNFLINSIGDIQTIAVSYTHLDVYKRQEGRLIARNADISGMK